MRMYLAAGVLALSVSSAFSQEIPAELKVKLQSAMIQYLDRITVDGKLNYIDTKKREVRTVFPANVHPMILKFGRDYLVCSEFVDESGKNITADFLVRTIGDEQRVVQMVVDDRGAIEAAMSKLKD
ncbi:MAG TPA: hypothetical protein VHG30_12150 [Microvirga sp.]|jgi:hypothetical protein|nr:hypothetical protein [Microvirga sp.]